MEEISTRPAISADILERVRTFFVQYASSFRKEDPVYNDHIKLKQHHTARVVKEISGLADSLGFNNDEIAFAEVIAWLHDIGRFEQYDTFATFADAESENHAEMALRVIQKNKLLHDFSDKHLKIIERTILNHNIKVIPEGESGLIDFYSRLLRDADKLDIWRVSLQTNIFHKIKTGPLPEVYIVPGKLTAYFRKNKTIPLSEVDSFYDSILFRLSWVFDLNFDCALEQFKERGLTQKFLDKLPFSAKLRGVKDSIDAYLNVRLSNTKSISPCIK